MLTEVMANFFLSAAKFFAEMSQKYQNEQQKYCVAACIFFCIASIEAYLNFLSDDFSKKNGTKEIKKGKTCIDLLNGKEYTVDKKDGKKIKERYVRFLDKLYFWPKIMTGNTFDKNKPPYKDFKNLVNFRNNMTHYKLKEVDTVTAIPDSLDMFATLFKEGLLYDPDVYHELTIEKAQETLRITYQVLKDLYGFYGYKDSWTRHGLNFFKGLP